MKLTMAHNVSITTFSQLSRYIELKETWQGFQTCAGAYVARSSQHGTSRFSRKRHTKAHDNGKYELKIKIVNMLTEEKEEARKISVNWNATIVQIVVILLMNALSPKRLDLF